MKIKAFSNDRYNIGTRKYTFLVNGKQDKTYFVRHISDSSHKQSEADIMDMIVFFLDQLHI
jgi:hypothetical protein